MNRIHFLVFLLVSSTAWGVEPYQQKVGQLQRGQAQIDQAIQKLNQSLGFSSARSDDPKEEGEIRRSLLRVHASASNIGIPTGKLLFGKLVNRLMVSGEASPVLIDLDEAQGALSGVRALGTARPSGSPGRVGLEIHKLLFPSRAVAIQAVGLDTDGALGLPAQVFSAKAWSVGGAMAGSFIAGAAMAQQSQAATGFGFSQVQPTGRNSILQGVAQTAADQSKRLIEEATAEKPVLVIEAGTSVSILVSEEVRW